MCGIATIFYNKPFPNAQQSIEAMTTRMQHRGPDAFGHYVDENVALGHRRLSIIDLSELGRQPMWDHSGRYGLVFNGEIYNYKDLRAQLSDYPFKSQSDTEVILAGFSVWGTELFTRLNGIFAFVLYDKWEACIYAVRDRFGIKPLYYTDQEDFFMLASEQRSIIQSGFVKRSVNREAIADYIQNGAVTGVQRCCDPMRQLQAGHFLYLKKGQGASIINYCNFWEKSIEPHEDSPEKTLTHLKKLLLQAVERQLVSDVPLGAFLSGGIDSASIVALMAEVSNERPLTFTIGFKEKQFDESGYADVIAKKFNTRHTLLTLSPDDFLHELPNALNAMDTPTLDGVNSYLVSKLTREAGVTVALSGLGGDELFAGYAPFMRYSNWKNYPWWRLPAGLRAIFGQPLAKYGHNSKLRRLGTLLSIPEYQIDQVYPHFRAVLDQSTIQQLLGHKAHGNPIQQFLTANMESIEQFPALSQYSIAEMSGYTNHILLKDTDQMSMASGLEVRVPFFDNDLVNYVLRIPDSMKYPRSSAKELLVKAMGDSLPGEIVHRPKMGFSFPFDHWMRAELFKFCDERIEALCDRNLLESSALRKLWSDFIHRKSQVLWSHVWMFVVLEDWLQRIID